MKFIHCNNIINIIVFLDVTVSSLCPNNATTSIQQFTHMDYIGSLCSSCLARYRSGEALFQFMPRCIRTTKKNLSKLYKVDMRGHADKN